MLKVRPVIASLILLTLLVTPEIAWGDLAPPYPVTFFGGRQNIPEGNTLIAIGLILSAVIVAGGMIISRMLRTIKAMIGIAVVAAILIAVIAYQTVALESWRAADHAKWQQFDIEVQNRRANRIDRYDANTPESASEPAGE